MPSPNRRKPWPAAAEAARKECIELVKENSHLWAEHESCLKSAQKMLDQGKISEAKFYIAEAARTATEVERNGTLIRLKLVEAAIGTATNTQIT